MARNSIETFFVARWKSLDFTTWNEMDIREEFVAPLLGVLGYSKGTINDVIREHALKLSEPYHRIGRQRVSIDYVPTVRMKQFWIIEAKPGSPRRMDFGDLLQAHLYAIHPEVQARFLVVTNGWEIRMYDALSVQSWDDVSLICTKENCETTFEELTQALGARNMQDYIRQRTVQALRDALAVEIDERRITSLDQELRAVVQEGRRTVRSNARAFQRAAWRAAEEEEKSKLKESSLEQLLVAMEIPTQANMVAASEYYRRVIDAEGETERQTLVDRLAMISRGRPHAVFRVGAVFVLSRLLLKGFDVPKSFYAPTVPDLLTELVLANARYWDAYDLANPLCHLDNTTVRIAKKLGLRLALDSVSAFVNALQELLPAEDLLREAPSIAGHMVGFVGLLAEILWRGFCSSSSAAQVWQGIWLYESLEEELDRLPAKQYPKGDADLLFFEHYGQHFDMLRLGTWDVLQGTNERLKELGISQAVIDFANLTRDEVAMGIPKPRPVPESWSVKTHPQYLHFAQLLEEVKRRSESPAT